MNNNNHIYIYSHKSKVAIEKLCEYSNTTFFFFSPFLPNSDSNFSAIPELNI